MLRDAHAGGQGAAAPFALSKDLIIFVQKYLKCALNRNLAPLPSVRAGVPENADATL